MKDGLSLRDACALTMVIQISKVVIYGFPLGAEAGTWMSIMLSLVGVVPLMLMLGRLVHLMPGKNLYGMMEHVFGRPVSIVLCVLYAYHTFTLSALVQGSYAEFVKLFSLNNTSFFFISLSFFAVSTYLAVSGTRTLGRWSSMVVLFSVVALCITFAFSIPRMRLSNVLPLMEPGMPNVWLNAYKIFALPFGDAFLLLLMAEDFEKKLNPYKMFLTSGIIAVVVCLALYLHNSAVLGHQMLCVVYFPLYKAASVIPIGTIGTRIESLVGFAFITQGIIKAVAALVACTKAITHIFRLDDYHQLVYPVGFFSVALASFIFRNIIDMFDYLETIYVFYAPFFQTAVPLVVWAAAEIKCRANKAPSPAAPAEN